MLLFAALIAANAVPAVAAPARPRALQPFANAPDCPRTTNHYAWRKDEKLAPQKLTELPPANAYAAVWRHNGRCEDPVVIRFNVGGR